MKKILRFLLIVYAFILCVSFSTPVIFHDEIPLTPALGTAKIQSSEIQYFHTIHLELNYEIFHLSNSVLKTRNVLQN